MAETELISVHRAETQAAGDVIFVHGLEGDSSGSWVLDRPNSWGEWLSRNRPDLNIWSLKYDVHASEWTGHSMPLPDRALNVLALFDNKNIGSRPIVFVCHSMGGLLAKEIIRHSTTVTPRFKRVADQTRGIVFFSTPHAGSHLAGIAQFLKYVLRTTASISELAPHEARLRDLNIWFRNNYMQLNILPCIFFETQNTAGVRVVDETSSDGGYPKCSPIPIDATHITITKPRNYNHITVGQTLKLIDEAIPSLSYRYNHEIDFPDVAEFSVSSIPADSKKPPPSGNAWRGALQGALCLSLIVIVTTASQVFIQVFIGQSLFGTRLLVTGIAGPLIAGIIAATWFQVRLEWSNPFQFSLGGIGGGTVNVLNHTLYNDERQPVVFVVITCLALVSFSVAVAISWFARRVLRA
ncbi:hypothetical protein ACVIGB_002517 [Bradyrhizobium sp. USDA 4341]